MEKWKKDYIDAMRIWFKNDENQTAITLSNIENADKMVKLYSIELKNKKEQLKFDLKRNAQTIMDYNKWCDDNNCVQNKII